ncbi:L-seryl-tRNA(Sec) kinase isoform 3 [Scophthalmus maximus]|uniref:L-seryl-tRNA(Sec) kinase isoform 3 n=1 Tax=Scophthalmus maximus TaxID=52904 RepID=A0A2U9CMT5_SCOMX|nr:L-seryl-tRNA(Sec) kinase [Scophthalmus maximus]AWP17871.1 L-seryl-tRNA(Sec) kinase isoform 3 [Scophthalmus maximus]
MAAEEAAGVRRAPACLCVLCGLPATGKSTLARAVLCPAAQLGWRAAVVPYDELIPGQAFQTRAAEDGTRLQAMQTEWKLHRQAVLQGIDLFLKTPDVSAEQRSSCQIDGAAWERCIHLLLQQPGASDPSPSDRAPLVFLLDDNFYYPSMRYEVYQLARKYSLGFCQVYLHCDLESCISRNQSRPEPVPTEVIQEMVKRLEPPDPQRNSWEAQSISLNTADGSSKCDIQRVTELISSALRNPLSPVEDNTEQKEADRLKCATSVVHQADQACRRLVSEAMRTARENQASSEHMRSMAAQLNESKAAFLRHLREQLLRETSFAQEDVDVERVVKRAVDVFDREKEEILLRVLNDAK